MSPVKIVENVSQKDILEKRRQKRAEMMKRFNQQTEDAKKSIEKLSFLAKHS
ncbi:hypothetical protein [Paenibacillus sp. MMO-58]|uniref:hypothetical protein n=1 Tax=Paenibacillus sp. MMO-58 TaxID=3081290 RepID=UPI00301849CD